MKSLKLRKRYNVIIAKIFLLIWKYQKAQIWMQVARNVGKKKRSLRGLNEHFSRQHYVQDAPNMRFSSNKVSD